MVSIKVLIAVFLVAALQVTSQYTDLKKAFDAGFIRAVDSGDYSHLSSVDPNTIYVQDCIPTLSYYSFPATPTGRLAQILSSKVFNLGTVKQNLPPMLDSTTNPPTGWTIEFAKVIVKNIGDNYNVNLNINWTIFTTSPAAFNALSMGQVQAVLPNFAVGAFYNGTRRVESFIPTCSITASVTSIYVKSTSNLTLNSIRSGTGLKVITSGAGSYAEAVAFFPSSFTIYDVSTNASIVEYVKYIFDQVRSGAYDIAWDNNPFGNVTADGLRYISSGLISPAVGFFDREVAIVSPPTPAPTTAPHPTPAPSPSPSPSPYPTPAPPTGRHDSAQNVININFANLLAR